SSGSGSPYSTGAPSFQPAMKPATHREKGGDVKTTAVIWPAAGEVEVRSHELPEPGPGDLLLEAECTLISPGTERAWFLAMSNTTSVFPRQTGYNFAGRVAAVGAEVDGFAVGDRVVSAAPHARHAVRAAAEVFPIPDGLATEEGVFFFMGAIALQGVRRPGIELVHMKGNVVYGAHNSARPESSRHGGWTLTDDALAVLQLLRHGRLQVGHLVSHRFPAAQAADAYEGLKNRDPSMVGVLLDWGGGSI
ncbi:MAG: hypothetical protein OXH50_08625, partial [Gemmatimonadetes bacterium]|nr:hypothetical protein [Gemmatimonadota bacterium]